MVSAPSLSGVLSALSAWLPRISDWHISASDSTTVSVKIGVDISAGLLNMTLVNARTAEVLSVRGLGAGPGIGIGVLGPKKLPTASLDPSLLIPKTPQLGPLNSALQGIAASVGRATVNSDIYVFPGKADSAHLFNGYAQVIGVAGTAYLQGSATVIVFHDDSSIKAFAFLAGLSFSLGVSAGLDDVIYRVTASPANVDWDGIA